MIFAPEHCAMNAAGTKTMTRRVKKGGDYAVYSRYGRGTRFISEVVRANYTLKYRVGNTYANQPGRGKKGNGRIRLLGIREERLQDISSADMTAEGIPVVRYSDGVRLWDQKQRFKAMWDKIQARAKDRWTNRWENNKLAWVLSYEFVKGSETE